MSYVGQPNYAPPPPYGGNADFCPPPPYGGNAAFCPPPPTTVIYQPIGDCPKCRQGMMVSNVTCMGVCCAIFLFPIGLVCLFLLQERTCPNCGFSIT